MPEKKSVKYFYSITAQDMTAAQSKAVVALLKKLRVEYMASEFSRNA